MLTTPEFAGILGGMLLLVVGTLIIIWLQDVRQLEQYKAEVRAGLTKYPADAYSPLIAERYFYQDHTSAYAILACERAWTSRNRRRPTD